VIDEEDKVEISGRILKVNDDKVCIEFKKSGGCDSMQFFNQFNKIKEYMDDYNNSAF
jgi:hypothetical protein